MCSIGASGETGEVRRHRGVGPTCEHVGQSRGGQRGLLPLFAEQLIPDGHQRDAVDEAPHGQRHVGGTFDSDAEFEEAGRQPVEAFQGVLAIAEPG